MEQGPDLTEPLFKTRMSSKGLSSEVDWAVSVVSIYNSLTIT